MTHSKTTKFIIFGLLVAFNLFIFRGTILAKRPPDTIRLKIPVTGKLKWKKQGNQKIPLSLTMGGKTFPFVKRGGQYAVSVKVKDLMAVSPEFKESFQLTIAEIGMMKIRELVGKDRAKAQQIADHFKSGGKGKSTDTAKSGGKYNEATINTSYETILNSTAHMFPMKPLPFAEEEESQGENEESQDEDESFLELLANLIFFVVVVFAPIVATIWLAAQAITCAMVLLAFFGSITAVHVAALVAEILCTIDWFIQGKPLIEIYN